jgi:hypothetical protein
MRAVEEFVDQVRARAKKIVNNKGKDAALKEMLDAEDRPSYRNATWKSFISGKMNVNYEVRLAYKMATRRPDLFPGIDTTPVREAGDFFRGSYLTRSINSKKDAPMEAASFLCSMFGWTNSGHNIPVPRMPDSAGHGALGRLAHALDMEPEALVDKLRRASTVRKAAMFAVREIDGDDDE